MSWFISGSLYTGNVENSKRYFHFQPNTLGISVQMHLQPSFQKARSHWAGSDFLRPLTGADLGGGCRGCAPPPPEMKPSSSYWLLKFVYLTGQWRHSLQVHPLLTKILYQPLSHTLNKTQRTTYRVQARISSERKFILLLCFWLGPSRPFLDAARSIGPTAHWDHQAPRSLFPARRRRNG